MRCHGVCGLGHFAGREEHAFALERAGRRAQIIWPMRDGSRLLRLTEAGLQLDLLNGAPARVLAPAVRTASLTADGRRVLFTKRRIGSAKPLDRDWPIRDGLHSRQQPEDYRSDGAARTIACWCCCRVPMTVAIKAPVQRFGYGNCRPTRPDGRSVLPARSPSNTRTSAISSASTDGTRLAFLRVDYQTDVYVADFDARRGLTTSPRRLTLDDRDDVPTAWTPDGEAVLFESARNGTSDIFKQRLDSDVAEPLVVGPRDQDMAQSDRRRQMACCTGTAQWEAAFGSCGSLSPEVRRKC